jgi:hypothetical protein
VTLPESVTVPSGSGEPPAAGPPGHHVRPAWRRRFLLALGALVATAVVILAVLAGTYQPVRFGGQWGGAFPGLPTGTGIRTVNNFGRPDGDTYVPQQSGVFTLTESIFNAGPQTVIIEAVSILSPQDQANIANVAPWPLTPAGPVRWMLQYTGPDPKSTVGGTSIRNVSLSPEQGLILGIPLRMSGICYDPNGWTGNDVVYVKERFLFFTHWVAVRVQSPWILHQPFDPGNRSSGPASEPLEEPAKDLICPSK